MYIIAITAHRDLKKECIPYYRQQLRELLSSLKSKHKDQLIIYSPLADGGDRLIVDVAIELDIGYKAIIPFPKNSLYEIDFDQKSLKEFKELLHHPLCKEIVNLPLLNGISIEDISDYTPQRDLMYEQVGHYEADQCNVLIALWDGKDIGLVGGTSEIVKYYLNKKKHKLFHLPVSRSKDVNNLMVEFKVYNSS
ncbi:MAG: hypothetical protein U9N59_16795 [Campylobacterota bacterium]|nr:hypothetical protein [Campylobacterota bacterium]